MRTILRFLADYWVVIGGIAAMLTAWGQLNAEVAQAQEEIQEISERVESPHPVTNKQIEYLIEMARNQHATLEEIRIAIGKMQLNQAVMCQKIAETCTF